MLNRHGLICVILAIGVTFTASSMAGELISSFVVVDTEGRQVGLFAGVATASTPKGKKQSVALVATPFGYVLPVLWNGTIASVSPVYFKKPKCEGEELLSVLANEAQIAAFPGLAYSSATSGKLRFIPKRQAAETVAARSHLSFSGSGSPVCSEAAQSGEFYTSISADNTSALSSIRGYSAIAIIATKQQTKESAASLIPSIQEALYSGGDPVELEDIQEECSPGCPVSLIGDGGCDFACYYPACSYDGGDCADVPPADIQEYLGGLCAIGCETDEVGDGFCDAACDNLDCRYDLGDCEPPSNPD